MATDWPGELDVFTRPAPGQPRDAPSETGAIDNLYDSVEAIERNLGTSGQWLKYRQAYLGTSQHGASDSNDGLSAATPKATMAGALSVLAQPPIAGAKPVGTVWVLPGRYSITPGNEWRINQRVAVRSYQHATGTGSGDPPVDPEAKVVVQPADGAVLDYLVGLGEPVWNPGSTDQWWHAGVLEGIMVWGRENDAAFTGAVSYGVRVFQLGENGYIHRTRAESCQVANWFFEGTAAGGMVGDIGTWNPGLGKTKETKVGGIGVRVTGSASVHIEHISGDSFNADAQLVRNEGSSGLSIGKIKAEGWSVICATGDASTQDFGYTHIGDLSWNPLVAGSLVTNPALYLVRRSSMRHSFKVDQLRLVNSGAPGTVKYIDWSIRDADAVMPTYLKGVHPVSFESHSKEKVIAQGGASDNWGGKTIAYGDVSLGEDFYLLASPDVTDVNPWVAWEYLSTGLWLWRNPDTDGFGWFFKNATITDYQAAGIRSLAQGVARLWSSGEVAIGGSVATPGPRWSSGTGTPEGAVSAPIGSLFSRTDGGAGTTLYVKQSGAGNTGWAAVTP